MSILIRKINKAKWLQNDILKGEHVSADAITLCMRTVNNTLSVWKIDDDGQANAAVLGIVSGGDHVESIDIISLDSDRIKNEGIEFIQCPEHALIPIIELKSMHYELTKLSYNKLGAIASKTVECFKNGQLIDNFKDFQVIRYTRAILFELLREGINNAKKENKFDPNYFSDSLKQELGF